LVKQLEPFEQQHAILKQTFEQYQATMEKKLTDSTIAIGKFICLSFIFDLIWC